MNESTRQALGAVFISLASAAGDDVMDEACGTITRALESGAVSDPDARAALTTLVESCAEDPARRYLYDRAQIVAGDLHQVALEIGSASLSRLVGHITRRVGRLSTVTDPEELASIVDMLTAVEAAVDRITPERVTA